MPERFTNIELDVFQIMPNHIHGIIMLMDAAVGTTPVVAPDGMIAQNNANVVGAGFTPAHNDNLIRNERAGASPALTKTVGDIVGAYKSLVANGCLELFKQKIRMK